MADRAHPAHLGRPPEVQFRLLTTEVWGLALRGTFPLTQHDTLVGSEFCVKLC